MPQVPPGFSEQRGSVLVVDDEELVGNAVKRVLKRQHDVVTVRSVDAALALIAGGAAYDVILSDLMMPEKGGMELFHEVAALRPGLEAQIVFVTGGAFTTTARRFLDSVPNAWLEKPFLPERLRALVSERLSPSPQRGR